jgi:hypothetical protein
LPVNFFHEAREAVDETIEDFVTGTRKKRSGVWRKIFQKIFSFFGQREGGGRGKEVEGRKERGEAVDEADRGLRNGVSEKKKRRARKGRGRKDRRKEGEERRERRGGEVEEEDKGKDAKKEKRTHNTRVQRARNFQLRKDTHGHFFGLATPKHQNITCSLVFQIS